jgi:hypothetical protein
LFEKFGVESQGSKGSGYLEVKAAYKYFGKAAGKNQKARSNHFLTITTVASSEKRSK